MEYEINSKTTIVGIIAVLSTIIFFFVIGILSLLMGLLFIDNLKILSTFILATSGMFGIVVSEVWFLILIIRKDEIIFNNYYIIINEKKIFWNDIRNITMKMSWGFPFSFPLITIDDICIRTQNMTTTEYLILVKMIRSQPSKCNLKVDDKTKIKAKYIKEYESIDLSKMFLD